MKSKPLYELTDTELKAATSASREAYRQARTSGLFVSDAARDCENTHAELSRRGSMRDGSLNQGDVDFYPFNGWGGQ